MTDENYIRDLLIGTIFVCMLTIIFVYAVVLLAELVDYANYNWREVVRVISGMMKLLIA